MWLKVSRFSNPTLGLEEEGDSFIFRLPVNYMAQEQILRIDNEPGLFGSLACHALTCRFIAFDMACDDAVISILIARVLPP